jgi:hypothetical protein
VESTVQSPATGIETQRILSMGKVVPPLLPRAGTLQDVPAGRGLATPLHHSWVRVRSPLSILRGGGACDDSKR